MTQLGIAAALTLSCDILRRRSCPHTNLATTMLAPSLAPQPPQPLQARDVNIRCTSLCTGTTTTTKNTNNTSHNNLVTSTLHPAHSGITLRDEIFRTATPTVFRQYVTTTTTHAPTSAASLPYRPPSSLGYSFYACDETGATWNSPTIQCRLSVCISRSGPCCQADTRVKCEFA